MNYIKLNGSGNFAASIFGINNSEQKYLYKFMIKIISPKTDFILRNVYLKDSSGQKVELEDVRQFYMRLGTPETEKSKYIMLTSKRLVDNTIYLDAKELQRLTSGQLLLEHYITFDDDNFTNDESYDSIYVETLNYYIKAVSEEEGGGGVIEYDDTELRLEITELKSKDSAQDVVIEAIDNRVGEVETSLEEVRALVDEINSCECTGYDDTAIRARIEEVAVDSSAYSNAKYDELVGKIDEVKTYAEGVNSQAFEAYSMASDNATAISGITERVGALENKPEVSLDGYATEEYVDNQFGTLDGRFNEALQVEVGVINGRIDGMDERVGALENKPEVSLDGYATEEYVDNKIDEISETVANSLVDLHNEIEDNEQATSASINGLDERISTLEENAGSGDVDLSGVESRLDALEYRNEPFSILDKTEITESVIRIDELSTNSFYGYLRDTETGQYVNVQDGYSVSSHAYLSDTPQRFYSSSVYGTGLMREFKVDEQNLYLGESINNRSWTIGSNVSAYWAIEQVSEDDPYTCRLHRFTNNDGEYFGRDKSGSNPERLWADKTGENVVELQFISITEGERLPLPDDEVLMKYKDIKDAYITKDEAANLGVSEEKLNQWFDDNWSSIVYDAQQTAMSAESIANGKAKVVSLTQSEYNNLPYSGGYQDNTIYDITDAPSSIDSLNQRVTALEENGGSSDNSWFYSEGWDSAITNVVSRAEEAYNLANGANSLANSLNQTVNDHETRIATLESGSGSGSSTPKEVYSPNLSAVGSPEWFIQSGFGLTIQSNLDNYWQFPFTVSLNKPFVLRFAFRPGAGEMHGQSNIIDSKYGLAIAMREGQLVAAMSSNGTNFDMGEMVISQQIEAFNYPKYVEFIWTGDTYILRWKDESEGDNAQWYFTTKSSTSPLHPTLITVGKGVNQKDNSFSGEIFLDDAELITATNLEFTSSDWQNATLSENTNTQTIWKGATTAVNRLSVDLGNIDEAGVNKINQLIDAKLGDINQILESL